METKFSFKKNEDKRNKREGFVRRDRFMITD